MPKPAAGSRLASAATSTNERMCQTAAGKVAAKKRPTARRVRGLVPYTTAPDRATSPLSLAVSAGSRW